VVTSSRQVDPPVPSGTAALTLPVAAVARRLGVAPSTLRTWDRRYGIGPTGHTIGQHRRYASADIVRLEVMQRELLRGATPAEAARYAIRITATWPAQAGPDGRADRGESGAVPRPDPEVAAFGPRPDLAAPPVERATAEQRWLAAVALGGTGRYAAAATVLTGLAGSADSVLAALALATTGSHRRQLGGHAAAARADAGALRRLADTPAGLSPAAARAWSDVLLGLAADAVGLGQAGKAARCAAAAAALGDVGWRGAVRQQWLGAEIALVAGDPAAAVPAAELAVRLAAAAPSLRHRVKSAMVLGAALAARSGPGDRDRAGRLVNEAIEQAQEYALLPLVWPCGLLLAELEPERGARWRGVTGAALYSVLRHTDPLGRHLATSSPWVPTWALPTVVDVAPFR